MTNGYNPVWPGGDGFRVVDKPVDDVQKAQRRTLRKRLVVDGERTYTAYSAHELMEIEGQLSNDYRPGMPY